MIMIGDVGVLRRWQLEVAGADHFAVVYQLATGCWMTSRGARCLDFEAAMRDDIPRAANILSIMAEELLIARTRADEAARTATPDQDKGACGIIDIFGPPHPGHHAPKNCQRKIKPKRHIARKPTTQPQGGK